MLLEVSSVRQQMWGKPLQSIRDLIHSTERTINKRTNNEVTMNERTDNERSLGRTTNKRTINEQKKNDQRTKGRTANKRTVNEQTKNNRRTKEQTNDQIWTGQQWVHLTSSVWRWCMKQGVVSSVKSLYFLAVNNKPERRFQRDAFLKGFTFETISKCPIRQCFRTF